LELNTLLTPVNSKPQQHAAWIADSDTGFGSVRVVQIIFYNDQR
jgi:hypothetical protein